MVNALVAARNDGGERLSPMGGLPHQHLKEEVQKYGRLAESKWVNAGRPSPIRTSESSPLVFLQTPPLLPYRRSKMRLEHRDSSLPRADLASNGTDFRMMYSKPSGLASIPLNHVASGNRSAGCAAHGFGVNGNPMLGGRLSGGKRITPPSSCVVGNHNVAGTRRQVTTGKRRQNPKWGPTLHPL